MPARLLFSVAWQYEIVAIVGEFFAVWVSNSSNAMGYCTPGDAT